MSFNYEERKQMYEYLKLLVKSEQEEIYRILKKNKEQYFENSNGIFFDLSNILDETFLQIQEYINFCLKTRQEDAKRLEDLESIRMQNQNYIDDIPLDTN